ncbi:hypothetical protein HHI36_011387 [Cryptolaemus montrouzieri]|uniref:Uncharacterized protein n=1 Tax=Cryptolaemus montrouzieri TaxID=559131 RepID=A0ABD2MLQ9_9CUCU
MFSFFTDYYWKPNAVFEEKEGLSAGTNPAGSTAFVGQVSAQLASNRLDVGEATKKEINIPIDFRTISYHESKFFTILSSANPEKFEWVNTTTDSFAMLDKSRLVPGGQLANGTKTMIGRGTYFGGMIYMPGSVRSYGKGTYLYYTFGAETEFSVLMFKDPEKK